MPHGPAATAQTAETVRRTVCMRLHPGNAATDIRPAALAAQAGTCRTPCRPSANAGMGCGVRTTAAPAVEVCVHSGQAVYGPAQRSRAGAAQDHPFACGRDSLKYPADAGQRYPRFPGPGTSPISKAQPCTGPGCTIPAKVRIRDGRRYGPQAGWRRPEGSAPYAGCRGGAFASGWKVRSRTRSGRPMSAMQCRRTR